MPSKDPQKSEWSTEYGEDAFPWHTQWAGCTYELVELTGAGFDPFLVLKPIPESDKDDVRWFDPLKKEQSSGLPRSPADQRTTPHEALAHLDLGNPDEVLRFVNRWGLLGLWEVPQYADWEPFPFWEREEPSRELATQQEPGIFSIAWFERERRRERWFGRVGWLNRQEPLPVFQLAAWHYQEWVNRIERFGTLNTVTDRRDAISEITLGFEEGDCPYTDLVDVPSHAPGFSLVVGGVQPRLIWDEGYGRWVFGWQYRSLLDAIYFATFLTMVQGDASGGFRRCANDRCSRFFIATRRNARFCSKLCEKAQTMRRLRANRSKE